jgi:hypothetical protein
VNVKHPVKRTARRKPGMTQETAQLLIDMHNVEAALDGRGDHDSVLLAAALAAYRCRLEERGQFVRIRPEAEVNWLKYIVIEQGNGWLKLTDTRVKKG